MWLGAAPRAWNNRKSVQFRPARYLNKESLMDFKVIVRTYISQIRPRAQVELNWFREQPTLNSAIEFAAFAIHSTGKRYSQQRRIPKTVLEQAKKILLSNMKAIEQVHDFDELHTLIGELLKSVNGIGELYSYDTSLRIGAKLNLMPQKVYFHAGTRIGARALSLKNHGKDWVEMLDPSIPKEFKSLEPHEIEDVLCIFKDNLKIPESDMPERSWCD